MAVETLQDAEQLAEHLIKNNMVLKNIGANPFVQSTVLLYTELRRLKNGSSPENNGDHR